MNFKTNTDGSLIGALTGVLIVVLIVPLVTGVIGWGLNVYKLTQLDFEPSYKAEIIRTVGIPIPIIGAIVGWMDIGEETEG